MGEDVKRSYRSPVREARATATRRTIRDAAARLFVADGYVSTTIRDIATEAGVAPRTVFAAFPGGKLELFHEALDTAVAGDELPLAVSDRPEFAALLADTENVVEELVRLITDLLDRAGALIMCTVESAGADPDMRRLAREGAAATLTNLSAVAEALRTHDLLRRDVTVEHAADVLVTLCSPHVHALLRYERGWTRPTYEEWLRGTVTATLLRTP